MWAGGRGLQPISPYFIQNNRSLKPLHAINLPPASVTAEQEDALFHVVFMTTGSNALSSGRPFVGDISVCFSPNVTSRLGLKICFLSSEFVHLFCCFHSVPVIAQDLDVFTVLSQPGSKAVTKLGDYTWSAHFKPCFFNDKECNKRNSLRIWMFSVFKYI